MWVRMRTRLALENLFLENPSFWNCYRHALTQIDHGSYHSLVHANRYNADTHQKGLGQKKASTICTETAKKRKSTAAGTQLLIGKDSTASKCRWSEGKEKAKWCWEIMSAQRDVENKPVTIGYLLLSQKNSHFSHFRIHRLFHWAGAAQWSSLRATDIPLVQLSDLAWLPSARFVAMQIRQGDHSSNPQHVSPAELQSTAQQ